MATLTVEFYSNHADFHTTQKYFKMVYDILNHDPEATEENSELHFYGMSGFECWDDVTCDFPEEQETINYNIHIHKKNKKVESVQLIDRVRDDVSFDYFEGAEDSVDIMQCLNDVDFYVFFANKRSLDECPLKIQRVVHHLAAKKNAKIAIIYKGKEPEPFEEVEENITQIRAKGGEDKMKEFLDNLFK